MKNRNQAEEGRKNAFDLLSACRGLVACSLFLVPLLAACKPAPPTTVSEKLERLEVKAEQTMEKTKEAVGDLAKRFESEREIYARRFEGKLQKLKPRLEALKRQAETAVERRPELERKIASIENRAKGLRESLTRVKSASAKDWDELKKPWEAKGGSTDDEDQILKETEM